MFDIYSNRIKDNKLYTLVFNDYINKLSLLKRHLHVSIKGKLTMDIRLKYRNGNFVIFNTVSDSIFELVNVNDIISIHYMVLDELISIFTDTISYLTTVFTNTTILSLLELVPQDALTEMEYYILYHEILSAIEKEHTCYLGFKGSCLGCRIEIRNIFESR